MTNHPRSQRAKFKVKLVLDKGASSRMSVGDKRPGACYDVLIDGVVIGRVEKCSEKSYRSEGTGSPSLWGFRGYSLIWRGKLSSEENLWADSVSAYSRKAVLERLIKHWKEAGR